MHPAKNTNYPLLLQDACCWSCVRCREDSVVVGEDQCRRCPIGYVPGPTKDLCLKLDASNLDWNSPWTFFPIILSTLGIGVTLEVRGCKTQRLLTP